MDRKYSIIEFDGLVFVEEYNSDLKPLRTFYGFRNRDEAEEFLELVEKFRHIKSIARDWREVYKEKGEILKIESESEQAIEKLEEFPEEIREFAEWLVSNKNYSKTTAVLMAKAIYYNKTGSSKYQHFYERASKLYEEYRIEKSMETSEDIKKRMLEERKVLSEVIK